MTSGQDSGHRPFVIVELEAKVRRNLAEMLILSEGVAPLPPSVGGARMGPPFAPRPDQAFARSQESTASFHRVLVLGGAVDLRRLPQLDSVPLWVCDPPETAVCGVLHPRVDVHTLLPQGRE